MSEAELVLVNLAVVAFTVVGLAGSWQLGRALVRLAFDPPRRAVLPIDDYALPEGINTGDRTDD